LKRQKRRRCTHSTGKSLRGQDKRLSIKSNPYIGLFGESCSTRCAYSWPVEAFFYFAFEITPKWHGFILDQTDRRGGRRRR
jgi:hypothetical protein